MNAMSADSYDDIPYDSVPVHETHPANLGMIGTLFGLTPPAATHCRYLELGCASGGNLIPLACALPESEFVGIERSAEQAATARALVAALDLRNIRIEQADVLDLEIAALGRFDYIVAHGFYSWVPDAVRVRLFEIMAATLTAHGIGYVSYNVNPGWRWRGMVRDLLRYGARTGSTPREQLALAQATLQQTEAALAGQPDPVAALVHNELATLRTRHPSYLYHEYLVDENTPFLFSEFMAAAGRYGLQYLAETELHTMFPDGLGAAASAMVDTANDIIAQEQLMDFLRLRLFRQTLLCRAGLPIGRELDLERFAGLAYYADLATDTPPDLGATGEHRFRTAEGETCVVNHPLTRAALLELAAAYPDAVAYPALVERAAARVQAAGGPAGERDELLIELLRLFLRQYIGASLQPESVARSDPRRPRATALARAQAAAGLGHVATIRHKPMELDPLMTRLLGYLDGRRERAALAALLVQDLEAGRLQLEGPLPERRALTALIDTHVTRLLARLAQHGLLEPGKAGP